MPLTPRKLPTNYNQLHGEERRLVRERYVRLQEGLCHHCRAPLSGSPSPKIQNLWITPSIFPENFFDHPVHLHHDHRTGMTIGAVHARCNAVLWEYDRE